MSGVILNMTDTSKVDMIMEMTGCDQAEAEAALLLHPNDIIAAMDFLLPKKTVSGAKYIPPKPVVNNGLDEEQRARCEKGRWMQDKVNAVFSVAHSKTLPDQPAEQASSQSAEAPVLLPAVAAVEESESSPDNRGQTAQSNPQSEPLR